VILRFRYRPILALTAVLLLTSGQIEAREAPEASLIIVGPGDPLYTYWGHIGIAIGEDFYDFGNFSFHSDHFYSDFAMGRMLYLGMRTPTDLFLAYSMTEDRDLYVYPLNLGPEELELLDSRLREWMLPENREYLYDYFLNNCSTIIRDILNEVTGGELKKESAEWQGVSFRQRARTGAHQSFGAEVLLHFLLGPAQDKPIDGWELMFLPQAVADIAVETEYRGADGRTRILAGEPMILKESTRKPVPSQPRTLWPWLLLVGILASIGYAAAANLDDPKRKGRIIGRIFRTLVVLGVGLPGAVLGFLMVFTDHAAAYSNLNIGPALPTVLLGIIPIWMAGRRSEVWLSWIWTANLLGLAVVILLRLTGLNIQDAGAFWALYAPVTLICSRPGLWIRDRLTQ